MIARIPLTCTGMTTRQNYVNVFFTNVAALIAQFLKRGYHISLFGIGDQHFGDTDVKHMRNNARIVMSTRKSHIDLR